MINSYIAESAVFCTVTVIYILAFAWSVRREILRTRRLYPAPPPPSDADSEGAHLPIPTESQGAAYWMRRIGLICSVFALPWSLDVHGTLGLLPVLVSRVFGNLIISLFSTVYSIWLWHHLIQVFRRLAIAKRCQIHRHAGTTAADAAVAPAEEELGCAGTTGTTGTINDSPSTPPGNGIIALAGRGNGGAPNQTTSAPAHVLPAYIRYPLIGMPVVFALLSVPIELVCRLQNRYVYCGINSLLSGSLVILYCVAISTSCIVISREMKSYFAIASRETSGAAESGVGGVGGVGGRAGSNGQITGVGATVLSAPPGPLSGGDGMFNGNGAPPPTPPPPPPEPSAPARPSPPTLPVVQDGLKLLQRFTFGNLLLAIFGSYFIMGLGIQIVHSRANESVPDPPAATDPVPISGLGPLFLSYIFLAAVWYGTIPLPPPPQPEPRRSRPPLRVRFSIPAAPPVAAVGISPERGSLQPRSPPSRPFVKGKGTGTGSGTGTGTGTGTRTRTGSGGGLFSALHGESPGTLTRHLDRNRDRMDRVAVQNQYRNYSYPFQDAPAVDDVPSRCVGAAAPPPAHASPPPPLPERVTIDPPNPNRPRIKSIVIVPPPGCHSEHCA